MSYNQQSFIRIIGEKGRLSLGELQGKCFPNVNAIELHYSKKVIAEDWLNLARAVPDLENLVLMDGNGHYRLNEVIYELKILHFLKALEQLQRASQATPNRWLNQSLQTYQRALAGIIANDCTLESLVKVCEHLSMTLGLINQPYNISQDSIEKYLSFTESLFGAESKQQWYLNINQASNTLMIASIIYTFAIGLVALMTMPYMALCYFSGALFLPMVFGFFVGGIGHIYSEDKLEKEQQSNSAYQAGQQIGLFFYPKQPAQAPQLYFQHCQPSAPEYPCMELRQNLPHQCVTKWG